MKYIFALLFAFVSVAAFANTTTLPLEKHLLKTKAARSSSLTRTADYKQFISDALTKMIRTGIEQQLPQGNYTIEVAFTANAASEVTSAQVKK